MKNIDLIQIVEKYDDVVIVGCGKTGKYLYGIIKHLSKNIAFCDNNNSKLGDYQEYRVLSFTEAARLLPNAVYLLGNSSHYDSVKKQLFALEILVEQLILAETDELISEVFVPRYERAGIAKEKVQFEINLAEHCNLNCKCCSQMSSICEEEFYDVLQFKKDMERMSSIFAGECEHIFLIGGEPLLHPQIGECVYIARKCFPIGEIDIFTNALLLDKMDESFWKNCQDNRISIIVTKYPIKLDYEKISKKAQNYDISFRYYNNTEVEKSMESRCLDPYGQQDGNYSFNHCLEANWCTHLKNGRLYTCATISNLYKYNLFFGNTFEVCDSDSLDIYKDYSKEYILDWLSKPVPACRYCNKKIRPKKYEWGISEKCREEWVCGT